ncbi:MAG: thiamine pyrophosphate-dependent dehydrogenase E1 component subunit alpha [Ignavibacteriales bacterium]|nr:thiamine pyrophosphate-dependent dehydrogenase E1 component subunit alpha [Ignavibacteriales bacterium]
MKSKSSTSKKNKRSEISFSLSKEQYLQLYYYMRLTREFEESILKLYRQGKIVGGAYTGNGNEATAVGSAFALEKQDYLFPMHRDMGAHLVKGQSLRNLMLQHLARGNSLSKGRDGTGHYADSSLKIYGNISHLGAMVPMACGVALASKLRKEKAVVLTYIGDGGANVGDIHESLAMASVMKLPLVLIIENNQFAYSTPVAKQKAMEKYSDRAMGYGVPGYTIDGTDLEEVYSTCKQAVERARRGKGPTLIESVTMRMHGHSAHDGSEYVPKELLAAWKKKDPVMKIEKLLTDKKILTPKVKEEYEGKIIATLDDAIQFAVESPYPSGEEAITGVYAA